MCNSLAGSKSSKGSTLAWWVIGPQGLNHGRLVSGVSSWSRKWEAVVQWARNCLAASTSWLLLRVGCIFWLLLLNQKFKYEKQDWCLFSATARIPPVQPEVSLRVEWPSTVVSLPALFTFVPPAHGHTVAAEGYAPMWLLEFAHADPTARDTCCNKSGKIILTL